MTENNKMEVAKNGVVDNVKTMLDKENVKARFNEVLGKKSSQFMASIVNTVSVSSELKKCDAGSILAAAYVAATFDLPIDPNLGFAAIVPYKRNVKDEKGNWHKVPAAQFQMMYKGFIQLAIRSGEYEKMNCAEVYSDEIVAYNPILGEPEFVKDFSKCTQRDDGDPKNVAGYYAWFRLKSGFTKELYMSKQAVMNHAKKYSQAFRYDLSANKQASKWSTDFDAMAKKTVIKLLLSKWGILSIQMQEAIIQDQKTFDADGESTYGDNQPDVEEAIDPFETHDTDAKENVAEVESVSETGEGVGESTNEEFERFEKQFDEDQLPFK